MELVCEHARKVSYILNLNLFQYKLETLAHIFLPVTGDSICSSRSPVKFQKTINSTGASIHK